MRSGKIAHQIVGFRFEIVRELSLNFVGPFSTEAVGFKHSPS